MFLFLRHCAIAAEIKQRWFYWLDTLTEVIEVNLTIDFPRGQKDAKILTCALAAEADFLIAGDQDFRRSRLTE